MKNLLIVFYENDANVEDDVIGLGKCYSPVNSEQNYY